MLKNFIVGFNYFCMIYTLILSSVYLCQLLISNICISRDMRRKTAGDYDRYVGSDNLFPVSILIPAYNEQDNLAANVRSLLKLDYPEYELIVINDGSADGTHQSMLQTFGLYEISYPMKNTLPTSHIRGVYYNIKYPNLLYIDKRNGGKSDALNAGINFSKYPLFVSLDADSQLESDAILKLAAEFLKDTKTVVSGGFVRVSNGSAIEDGKWKSFHMPSSNVERFQIIEYFRTFLSGRISWNAVNSLLIISGAFGVFNKQVVVECGGYRTDSIGEDMEIILRIHKYLRRKKRKYKIVFSEDAVCWTQAPSTFGDLRKQRRRWQIGLMNSLLIHHDMLLNPKMGFVGLLAVPYSWLFELLGALIEALGYILIPLSFIIGIIKPFVFILFLIIAALLGIMLSLGGLILEQSTRKGVLTARQCMQLSLYALLENFGYRQFVALCRAEGMLRYGTLKNTWAKVRRKKFNY